MRIALWLVLLAVVYPAASRAQLPSRGLLLYYPFDGTAADSTAVAGSTVPYNCTYTADRYGVPDRALWCNGTTSRVVVADHPKFNLWGPIAVSVWVKPASIQTTGMRMVFGKSNYRDVTNYLLRITPHGFLQWEYGIYSETRADSLVPDRWYHVYVDGVAPLRTRRIFINGRMVPSDTVGSPGIHGLVPDPLTVGAAYYWTADCSEFFHGAIDELRMYDRILTAQEIAALANDRPAEAVTAVPAVVPGGIVLAQNYPNPFNPRTTVRYVLPLAGMVDLRVSDVLGREVYRIVESGTAGVTTRELDLSECASGIYYCTLRSGGVARTVKMALVR